MSDESQKENLLAENEAFECELCPSVFFILLKSGLEYHIEQSHTGLRLPDSPEKQDFTCIMCKLIFKKEILFSKHMVSIHGENMKKKKSVLKVKINKEKE